MPNRIRNLSGDDIVSIFEKFGFTLSFSKGSHCKLSRIVSGEKQVIVVPRHASVAKGTIKSIYRKATVYLGEEKLKPLFYTD
ncbi:MAG: type II toxin-antitoxin system HicA family toxin [Phenylobacterium sp.]|uniref:type II toxin-antitoxin system HicA family toxin n=1 Tax=Phenylobacterium sp. TaxID=1871053 RepID=UPI0027323EE3|nr:type II toxin-antitoxin system HicA family toxin [Phenylobacterium sp.]MDP3745873.1 type II toxin-antitoxin system HicA family toxin [Phenylobacterium sp.]